MADGKDDDYDEKKELPTFSWMPAGCTALADGEYDAIVLGTGLTECIISGLLSVQGKRVLHLDRNNYYGAETASLSLQNLFQKFRSTAPPGSLGASRGTAAPLPCSLAFTELWAQQIGMWIWCPSSSCPAASW